MTSLAPGKSSFINYPYCYQHDVFNVEELQKIINYCNTLQKQEALVATGKDNYEVNNDSRISEISWIDLNVDTEWIYNKFGEAIQYLNNTFYEYDLVGFNRIQFAKYDFRKLAKYDIHMDVLWDTEQSPLSTVKLSAVLLLNDNFEGGQFEYTLDGSTMVETNIKAGTLIVFPSYLLHRVKQVAKGTRYSLVAWCIGPKFK